MLAANVLSVEANRVKLAYVEQGKGQPVIFVHGTPADYRAWIPHIEPFAKKHRTISYSRRCSYPNKYTGNYDEDTIANNAEDLAALIKKLDAAPAHLIGHSYGAFVAAYCALYHPELASTLVLAEPPAFSLTIENPQTPLGMFLKSPSTASALMELVNKALVSAQEAIRHGDPKKAVRVFIDGASDREGVFEQLPAPVRSMLMENSQTLGGEIDSVMTTRFSREDAARIRTPTLLAKGEFTPRIMSQIIDILAETMPKKEVAIFRNASHAFPFEKLDEFNSRVLDFIAKHI